MTVSGVQRTVIGGNTLRGAWLVTTGYVVDDAVTNGGETYVCIVNHTATAADEPGVGANWEDFWALVDFVASDSISYYPAADGMLHMPSGWTAASIAFLVAREPEGPYVPLYDTLGNIVEVTPAVDNTYVLPASLAGVRFIKLWSQTGGVNEAQALDRVFILSVDTG